MTEPATNYLDVPSPFGLPRPGVEWLRTLAAFDADLVIFPSQKMPGVYRLARRARKSGGITARMFQKVGSLIHPDTKLMFDHRIVAVTTVPAGAVGASCEHLCAQLALRDTWRYGLEEDGAAKALERMEAEERIKARAAWKDENRVRHRASRVGFQYRTGARVSLVSSRGGTWPTRGFPSTAPAASAVSAPSLEVKS